MHDHDRTALLKRLNCIEGQVRGIAGMVEDDRYCIDVVTQIAAVRAALARVEQEVLRQHMQHCVAGASAGGNAVEKDAKIAELVAVLARAQR